MYQSAPDDPVGTVAVRSSTVVVTTKDWPSALGAMFPSSNVNCGSLLPNVSVAVCAELSQRALQELAGGGGGGGGSTLLTGVVVPSRVCMRLATSGTPHPDT